MSRAIRIGDPVHARLFDGAGVEGTVLGFEGRKRWDATKLRSYRYVWVQVRLPSGRVVTVPPTAVTQLADG